jgi:hypothetical protein
MLGCSEGELTPRILRIKKRMIRLMAAVNPVTCCRQIFKELRIFTIVSLYILEVISYFRRHHQVLSMYDRASFNQVNNRTNRCNNN